MKNPTLEEAKEIIESYPERDFFIDANYQMWMAPGFGMDDNSIELSWYYSECLKILNENRLTPTPPSQAAHPTKQRK